MNNTKTLAIVAIFMAATLVVGTFAATTTVAQSAFAYSKKKGAHDNNGNNSKNGNTVTIEECKNRGSASGFDTSVNQECEKTICTHRGSNATCVSESEGAVIISNNTNAALCPGGGFFNPSAGKCVGAGEGGT